MIPESTYQMPEAIENDDASPFVGFSVATPIPRPSMVNRTWTTRPTTTPAKIAPQETRLIMMVWASSSAVACRRSNSPGTPGMLVEAMFETFD